MTDAPEPTPETPRPSRFFSEGRAGFVALGVSILALIFAVLPYASGGDFDGRVRAYLLKNPQILQEVSMALQAREDTARVSAVQERAAANPALLAADPRDPAFGPADARVTVIEFFDFRCPGCKLTAPDLLRLMDTHPDVRFVFKDWPILDRGDDDVSHYAARAAQAAHRQGRYLGVFRALMATPALDKEGIDRILTANGVSLPQARTDMAGSEVASHLADIHTQAAALQLSGTPTFFVAGKPMASIQPADIDRAIRAAKAAT
ncbi:DsbA family protein [Brevundimonas sp.]|uniref:DsbA family protein n=1 Tax=Brevundimonas sp. TaxID=1871086 RepID=UPI0035670852